MHEGDKIVRASWYVTVVYGCCAGPGQCSFAWVLREKVRVYMLSPSAVTGISGNVNVDS